MAKSRKRVLSLELLESRSLLNAGPTSFLAAPEPSHDFFGGYQFVSGQPPQEAGSNRQFYVQQSAPHGGAPFQGSTSHDAPPPFTGGQHPDWGGNGRADIGGPGGPIQSASGPQNDTPTANPGSPPQQQAPTTPTISGDSAPSAPTNGDQQVGTNQSAAAQRTDTPAADADPLSLQQTVVLPTTYVDAVPAAPAIDDQQVAINQSMSGEQSDTPLSDQPVAPPAPATDPAGFAQAIPLEGPMPPMNYPTFAQGPGQGDQQDNFAPPVTVRFDGPYQSFSGPEPAGPAFPARLPASVPFAPPALQGELPPNGPGQPRDQNAQVSQNNGQDERPSPGLSGQGTNLGQAANAPLDAAGRAASSPVLSQQGLEGREPERPRVVSGNRGTLFDAEPAAAAVAAAQPIPPAVLELGQPPSSMLLTNTLPFDSASLGASIKDFFDQLEQRGLRLSECQMDFLYFSGLMAAAAAAIGLETVRRIRRRAAPALARGPSAIPYSDYP